jgi:hypothetical protein
MLSLTSYLCRRHGHHEVPDVMMSLKGAVGGPKYIVKNRRWRILMSMDCIRSRGIDRLNLSRVYKHSKLNHGLFFLYWFSLEDQKNTATLLEVCCEYEISEMLSLTSYLCRRHGHHGVPDVMMSLKGACIRSRGIDRLNLSRVFKHSKLNHGLFFLYWVFFFFIFFFHNVIPL